MVPVTEAAEPFGAPTARMFTTPCVITVEFGVVNDGEPKPNEYAVVDDCFPVGDFTKSNCQDLWIGVSCDVLLAS
jgi:hypothetical protein